MYGRDALRRFREQHGEGAPEPARQVDGWTDIPPDAPADDATITVWNGNGFVAYEKWLATAPLVIDETPIADSPVTRADADCVVGDCGGARISLVRDAERWLMFAGSRKNSHRRRDFASPFLAHAIRTAEQCYSAPARGWHAENLRETSEGKYESAEVVR